MEQQYFVDNNFIVFCGRQEAKKKKKTKTEKMSRIRRKTKSNSDE